ncbi:uncharacterized protein PAC_12807 [Phialocephala subalpina]|uniref:N-acetyltransferase domain-containing protein n=1 Tax=Phialocephala subalpina TaxID=576137 RepID=A0A1L7XCZ1_9HELO|nr:uncharacterized protein PAC_12807 [Phialocephala subalpina]
MTTQPEEFTLLPLNFPDDAQDILRMHYQIYLSDPLHSSLSSTLQTPEQYTTPASHPPSRDSPNHTPFPQNWSSPPPPKQSTRDEKDKELREDIEKRHEGGQAGRVYDMMREDQGMNERLLGSGYEGRWWELGALATDENFQRRGLGTRLAKWGLERIEEDVRSWNVEIGEGRERIEGCYLVASPQGARTYEKAGFVKIGEREMGLDEGKYMHAWFVKRFERTSWERT